MHLTVGIGQGAVSLQRDGPQGQPQPAHVDDGSQRPHSPLRIQFRPRCRL